MTIKPEMEKCVVQKNELHKKKGNTTNEKSITIEFPFHFPAFVRSLKPAPPPPPQQQQKGYNKRYPIHQSKIFALQSFVLAMRRVLLRRSSHQRYQVKIFFLHETGMELNEQYQLRHMCVSCGLEPQLLNRQRWAGKHAGSDAKKWRITELQE